MDIYKILLGAHSGLRYIVLLLVLIALIQSLAGWLGQKSYTNTNRKINLFAMISVHTQFLLGIILYFKSPFVNVANMAVAMKDDTLRYWTVEHAVMMLFAIILITVGHSKSKKAIEGISKHRYIAIYYGLATMVVIVAILQSGRPLIGR